MELSARSSQQWSPNAFVADGGGAKLQCQDVGGRDGTLCWGGKWEQIQNPLTEIHFTRTNSPSAPPFHSDVLDSDARRHP
ncbi:hypothetical protein ACSBR1_012177 [Camellia fascicularis]